MIGIYEIYNIISNKTYIGSSKTILERFKSHKSYLKRQAHRNRHLQHAWNKYGAEAFIFRPILICPEDELMKWEQKVYDVASVHIECYNIGKITASPRRGVKASPETRMKMSNYNKHHRDYSCPERSAKISKAAKKRTGAKNSHYKGIIYQLDLDGRLIQSFEGMGPLKEAGFNPSKVSECCNSKRATHKGFIWSRIP